MKDPFPMRVADRCDRCGAQAFVRVTVNVPEQLLGVSILNPVDLHFCGHHFRKYEPGLRAVASSIRDERNRINQTASPSATV